MLVLIIEDEQRICAGIAEMLQDEGFQTLEADSLDKGLRCLEEDTPEVILSDINLPDGNGFSVLGYCKAQSHDIPVIFMTAFGYRDLAIQAIRQGAYDYITKPIRFDELFARLYRLKEMQQLRGQVRRKARRKLAESKLAVLGNSRAMQRVRRMAEMAAASNSPVLITGETGVGKGLLAKLVHTSSKRCEKPFVSVNCASIPENLLESELFGYRKGAFTGADQHKKGLLHEAAEGTLFLDEIGNMPLLLQAKLLHVLDDGVFRPLGSTKDQRFLGRIIAATNVPAEELVQGEGFRSDLYYRLSVLTIDIPPLRDRQEDLIALAERIYAELATEMGLLDVSLPLGLVQKIRQQSWPGNVRQLRNYLERSLIFKDDGEEHVADEPQTLAAAVQQFERDWIRRTIAECGGDKARAARQLGIGLSTLYRKLED